MTARYTIGIDLGGTNIKGGVCDRRQTLLTRHAIETQAELGCEHVLERMARLVDDLLQQTNLSKAQIAGIGVGAPGPLSHAQGMIYHAPNLPGFVAVPLRDRFAKATGLPVVLENDANAAAYGEFTAGAGKDVRNMVMLTLGTGIGGGIVLDGKLWRGRYDNAGEIGHTVIVPDGRACPCGQRGCLERYASANAIAERLREAVAAGENSVLKPKITANEPFDARDVLQAAEQGDALAARIWDETCYYLALSVVNVRHLLNPELVVFAGGLINAGPRLLDPVKEHLERLSWKIAPDAPRIALATLGTDAGTIGAAALAMS
ncbi:MAG: ROK family protein [Phycisphaerae bacterium]|nr:ROK family protein [Phycisphaerae bacterium]